MTTVLPAIVGRPPMRATASYTTPVPVSSAEAGLTRQEDQAARNQAVTPSPAPFVSGHDRRARQRALAMRAASSALRMTRVVFAVRLAPCVTRWK